MKVGIDSYCFHRFFGEVYGHQAPPPFQMTVFDFLDFAKEVGVDGVSLESCFLPSFDKGFLAELKARLDEYGFDRVYAWGHPDGLEAGRNEAAYHDMIKNVEYAAAIGAPVMRICASSFTFRLEPHRPQMEKLVPWLKEGARVAESYGIKMAADNHID